MKTREKIEKKGYKVIIYASGRGVQAIKINKETGSEIGYPIVADNITQLYEKLS